MRKKIKCSPRNPHFASKCYLILSDRSPGAVLLITESIVPVITPINQRESVFLSPVISFHLVVKPSTGKTSAFWGNTEVFVDGSAQHDTITMLKDGKIGEFEASSLQVMLFIEYICAALKQLIETLYNF